jgi:phenylalanyl-tRNA synthetase alpha chain
MPSRRWAEFFVEGGQSVSLVQQAEAMAEEFARAAADVAVAPAPDAVEALRLGWLGRKGRVTALLEGLRNAPKEERPLLGKAVNVLKQQVEARVAELQAASAAFAVEGRLAAEALDISLPVTALRPRGSLHPVSLMRQDLLREFRKLGFTVYDGPEVVYELYNFSALNIAESHPARDMQDTFHVREQERLVLRTHTSNIQIHCMLNEKPPLRIVAPGRVFRCDFDPTHTPMFHQIEAFVVDKGITFAHMKGVIDTFMKAAFGSSMKTRLRPSFFPFVEPGAEMDLMCVRCSGKGCRLCKETGWLEVGGCGMIHPNVFEAVEYDSEFYSGFAFGFGIDRMAMLRYDLDDLRQLFEGNDPYLAQFPVFGL